MPSIEPANGVQELLKRLNRARLENEILRLSAENALLRLQDHPYSALADRADRLLEVLRANAPGTDWAGWALDLQRLQREAGAV
jgi:hypothetical protein